MNNVRRKQLKDAKQNIQVAENCLRTAYEIIDNTKSDEEDSFDNLSEGLQQTMRGEQMEENVDTMQEALDKLDEILNCFEEVVDYLNDVM